MREIVRVEHQMVVEQMISEANRIQQEQKTEEQLRFQFKYNSQKTSRAIKQIAREFPDLRSDELESLHSLARFARNLLVDPSQINSISNFSLTFGAEFEATIIINGIPFDDFLDVQNRKFQEVLDSQIQDFSRLENLKRPGFVPTDFDNITGWTTMSILSVKSATDFKVAEKLEVNVSSLSYNEIEKYVFDHPDIFDQTIFQALRLYRYIILKSLTDIITNSLLQIFEDILIVTGSMSYSDVALTLCNQLNVNNRKSLELTVEAERNVIKKALNAVNTYGAIFPQLRSR